MGGTGAGKAGVIACERWATCEACLAGVTQLVEFLPSKQAVAGSSPVSRSKEQRFRQNFSPIPASCETSGNRLFLFDGPITF